MHIKFSVTKQNYSLVMFRHFLLQLSLLFLIRSSSLWSSQQLSLSFAVLLLQEKSETKVCLLLFSGTMEPGGWGGL